MITVLSPSKSMDTTPGDAAPSTQPEFLARSAVLIDALRQLSEADLMALMGISRPLAKLNRERFQSWQRPFTTSNAKQALRTFTGGVYTGLAASTFSPAENRFAQEHLRILSGLYGLLRPLDLIQPYRLEMGCPFAAGGAANLYAFWQQAVTDSLRAHPGSTLVNLASQEYAKVISPRELGKRIVSPIFRDEKNGRFKVISVYAKRARGTMARYIIRERITDPDALTAFADEGYRYDAETSLPDTPVFIRPAEARE